MDPNRGLPWTLAEIGRVYGDRELARVVERIRPLLPANVALDPDDPDLIMMAWFNENTQRAVDILAPLARACPTLRQFDWYPNGIARSDGVVLWRFSFEALSRLSNGAAAGDVISWLWWEGGRIVSRPCAFEVLVGEELVEYERRFDFAMDM